VQEFLLRHDLLFPEVRGSSGLGVEGGTGAEEYFSIFREILPDDNQLLAAFRRTGSKGLLENLWNARGLSCRAGKKWYYGNITKICRNLTSVFDYGHDMVEFTDPPIS
jgi:hypothetical protein